MCSIEKLLIKGIRSVDPHNETAVEFGAPLSLIVGQNGAGKTTIIECLKQATTGAMPPNSKNGQSFVHDPLIAGETEVKALIKLRLRTARDAAIVVFRSFSLTQNKSKKTFKTLDGSVMVQDDETGEMKVLTNKCAEMDKTVPYVMNVSRPILEHVVFVHQEDSLWPLSESKPLKEKFDAIFAATKYTAGLQKIKEDIKAKNQMIKECKIHLGHLKTHRDTARRLRASIKRDTEQQKTLQQRQAAVQEEMQTQKVKAAELEEKLRENEAAIAQIERLELKCGMHEAEVEKLRQALGDGFGDSAQSAAELQSICVKYEEKAARKREKASQLTQERREKEAELAALQEQAQAASSEAARKEAQLDAHRGKVKHAAQLAGTLAQQHGLAVAVPTGEELPEVLQSQLTAQLQQQQAAAGAELEELRGEQRRAQHSVQQQLSTVEAKLASFQADMQAKSDSQAAVQRKLQAARACLQGLPLAMKLENMRGDLEREKAQLDGRSVDAELQQAAADIDATATALRTAAQRVSELRRERDRLAAATQAATRFRVAQESAADLQSQVELLQKQHGPALKAALEELDEPLADIDEPAAAAAACSQLLGAAREQHGEAQRAADSKRQQLLSAQASLGGLQETMGKADSESKRAADRVAQTLDSCLAALTEHFAEEPEDVDAFQTAFSSSASLHDRFKQAEACLQKRRAEAENRSKEAAAQTRYSSTWVTKAKEQNLCAVCQRKFALPAECKEFIARFERNKESAVDNAKVDEEDAVELSKHLDQIAGMSHAVQKHSDWQQDRPGAVAKVQDMQTTCKSLEAEANKAKGDLESASKLLSFAQDLQSSLAAPMQQLLQQCQRVERELQELQLQLEGDEDASRLPQVDTAIQEAEQEVSTLTTSRDELMNKRTALSDDKVKHGRRILQLEQAYMKLTAEVKEREQLESQIVELEGEQSGIADKLSTLQQGNDPLKHQRGALQADLEKMRREHDSEERTKRQHVDGLAASVNQWSGALAEISQFRASGAESAIEDARKRLHDAQRDMQDHAEAVRQLEAAAQKAVDAVQLTEQLKRETEEALKYASAVEELQGVRAELAALRAASAGADWAAMKAQRDAATAKVHELDLRASTAAGELSGLKSRLRESEAELAQPQYADIVLEFRRKEVELRTLEMGNKDFAQYCKGLEKALLSYHSKKMESINQVLKELWQKTYRGQDIEYIEIRADTADSGKSAYNYRVIMHASGAELDMRGRCSAGQKVLACILIRMALAESFCANCGVIALDEPTTNLDMANSAALAQALRSILDVRSSLTHETDRVFQLIVITHDENFATQLGTHDYCEFMTRVTKDENNHTKLTEEPID